MTIIIGGNIAEAEETIIIHQCNCLTEGAKGVSRILFDAFPAADVYKKRKKNSTPGSVNIVDTNNKTIVNLFGQYNVGNPCLPNETDDMRKEWFRQGLDIVSLNLDTSKGVAMPYLIGCGLARGKWCEYYEIIYNWASSNDIQVFLYDFMSVSEKK